ncbi:hypothetical protein [Metabacillus sp. 84]|uniref:hypothetical protein n=1 Tax=Metabacillus sp. 84 TaxID=3404705 RepID=UPI003CF126CE
MKPFVKLLNFEINRFSRIYLVLILLTVICQFTSVAWESSNMMDRAETVMREKGLQADDFLKQSQPFYFSDIHNSLLFMAPIVIGICALLFYNFFIWYRDWFTGSPFIYRLLMIPVSRMKIFYAKTAALLLMVFGLIAFQMILFPIEDGLFHILVPSDFRTSVPYSETLKSSLLLSLLVPETFLEFILYYGIGIMLVLLLNTFILFERSFRWLGICMAFVFGLAAALILMIPFLLNQTGARLYPSEIIYLQIAAAACVALISFMASRYLLQKKITV